MKNPKPTQAVASPISSLAIMQPYFLPYLGYFQLMHAVDTFILYDDVAFISRGWINRNRLLVNDRPWRFTLPLKNASQNKLIKEIRIADSIDNWRRKLLKTIDHAYGKAPYYGEAVDLVRRCLHSPSVFLIDWLHQSLEILTNAWGLRIDLKRNSEAQTSLGLLKGKARILAICDCEGATTYINAANGQALYDRQAFVERGLALRFIQSRNDSYPQFGAPFVPQLSIIDVLMFNGVEGARARLANYDLI